MAGGKRGRFLRRVREGELPSRVKEAGLGHDSVPASQGASFHRGFRRLRAATYFAHGGSSSQWPRPPSLVPSGQFTLSPLHSVSAWRRKLRSFPCSSSSRRTRFAGLRREQRGIGQNAPGDAADGLRLRFAPPKSIGPLSPDPFYEGRSPVLWYLISGAQNLSECLNPRRATGPWLSQN